MNKTEKMRIAVLFGGANSDNYRSCQQLKDVVPALISRNFDVEVFGITLEGSWFHFDQLDEVINFANGKNFELTNESALLISGSDISNLLLQRFISFDAVYPLVIGFPGADGRLAGLFETLGIRVIGSDSLGSAIASDKSTIKLLFEAVEIATPKHVVIPDKAWRRDALSNVARAASLKLPIIVKPCRGTNGVGISLVKSPKTMKDAVAIARRFDGRFMAEEYYSGARHFECAVLEDSQQRNYVSAILETTLSEGDIFNYIIRTDPSKFSQKIVTDLPEEIVKVIKETTEKVFEATKISGYLQVEFLLTKEGSVLVLEANAHPYIGRDGSFAKVWLAAGLDYEDMIYAAVMEAIRRPVGMV
ncbi:MAG: ATP-grasp domain-containing protein [Candidatus Nanopelagicaceae bacterium]|nr:ATP-grasp domain-containing protein [Candidatus Nanopelagicaceae bacterium]